jgi:hypothetical protein
MKKEYMLVTANTVSDLEKAVDAYLSEGWELQGSAVIAVRCDDPIFAQAMILESE